jgi:hypothetical protein
LPKAPAAVPEALDETRQEQTLVPEQVTVMPFEDELNAAQFGAPLQLNGMDSVAVSLMETEEPL